MAGSGHHVGDADERPESTAHPGQVGGVRSLGDDPDQPVERDDLEDGRPPDAGSTTTRCGARDGQPGQALAPPDERLRDAGWPAVPGQVADDEGGGLDRRAAAAGPRRAGRDRLRPARRSRRRGRRRAGPGRRARRRSPGSRRRSRDRRPAGARVGRGRLPGRAGRPRSGRRAAPRRSGSRRPVRASIGRRSAGGQGSGRRARGSAGGPAWAWPQHRPTTTAAVAGVARRDGTDGRPRR